MKILLVYQSGTTHRTDPYINLLPTGLCYLHATLREAGHDSILANFSAWQPARIKRELHKISPDIIGISQWTHNRHISMALAKTCRTLFPQSTIIMGGGHATFCYQDILTAGSPVDIVVRGEGEATLLELVEHLASGSDWHDCAGISYRAGNTVEMSPLRKSIDDLDRLPLPARYMDSSVGVDIELQSEFLVTTRGCPSTCHFCSSPDFWGRKVRFRSPEAIVTEILYIRDKYGLIYFSIRDDTFTADRKRVLRFCTLLREQHVNILWNCQSRVSAIDTELLIAMKQAGCECIQLGVESGSPGILRKLGKKITPDQIEHACKTVREVGINLSIYLISDVPEESDDDIRQTLQLIRQLHPDDGYVSPLAYYPGTQLHKDAVAAGIAAPDLFSASHQEALYVKTAPGSGTSRLLKALTGVKQGDPLRFNRQKALLGYCYTTLILAAEWYRSRGEFGAAEHELREITVTEPQNPWGWLLLGDLYAEMGQTDKMNDCYATVLSIVPHHGSAKKALSGR